MFNGLSCLKPETFFRITRTETRGHNLKIFRKETPKHNNRLFFFSNRVISDWNNLSTETVNAASTNSFKSQLAHYFAASSIW